MKAAIVAKSQQNAHVQALAAGLKRHGIHVAIVPSTEIAARDYDFASCWSWRAGLRLQRRGFRVLLMERGYVADRFAWTSLAWGGLNGNGSVPHVDDGGARWRKHFDGLARPWRSGGEYSLLLGQVPGDQSIVGVDMQSFYIRAYAAAMRFGVPVRFRPHPVAVQRGLKTPQPRDVPLVYGTLNEALASARCAISYNSNSAVDAVLAGVPAIVCDQGSMAWPVAGHGLEADPPTPDRTAWCAAIAWRQWTLNEISSGAAWEFLKAGLNATRIAA